VSVEGIGGGGVESWSHRRDRSADREKQMSGPDDRERSSTLSLLFFLLGGLLLLGLAAMSYLYWFAPMIPYQTPIPVSG